MTSAGNHEWKRSNKIRLGSSIQSNDYYYSTLKYIANVANVCNLFEMKIKIWFNDVWKIIRNRKISITLTIRQSLSNCHQILIVNNKLIANVCVHTFQPISTVISRKIKNSERIGNAPIDGLCTHTRTNKRMKKKKKRCQRFPYNAKIIDRPRFHFDRYNVD